MTGPEGMAAHGSGQAMLDKAKELWLEKDTGVTFLD